MDQLIQAFGIDVKLIVVQIINFVILTVVLTYFLYKPVLKVLADRRVQVEQGIKDAEAAAEAKATAEAEKQTILTQAHAEAESVNQRAKASADEQAGEITGAAEHKAAEIVRSAEQRAEELKDQSRKESEAEVAKLAVLAAEKILKEKSS